MATYNYTCLKCKNVFGIEATLQEKEEGGGKFVCSKCGSKEIKQDFSAVNFIKNIFAGGSGGGCCGGSHKPDERDSEGCCGKNSRGGCCGN